MDNIYSHDCVISFEIVFFNINKDLKISVVQSFIYTFVFSDIFVLNCIAERFSENA